MLKIYTRFQTKTAQKPYPLGRHIPIYLIGGRSSVTFDIVSLNCTSTWLDSASIVIYCCTFLSFLDAFSSFTHHKKSLSSIFSRWAGGRGSHSETAFLYYFTKTYSHVTTDFVNVLQSTRGSTGFWNRYRDWSFRTPLWTEVTIDTSWED